MPEDNQLELKKHRKLIRICLAVLPSDYAVFQTSKPTVLFFLLSSLELLGDLDRQLSAAAKRRMISSVYSLQLKPQQLTSDLPLHKCGFLGSASCSTDPNVVCPYDGAHIAQTYTALCSLLLLGDDLAQVDRVSLLKALRCFQSEDGSFFGTGDGHSENDMRFVFCASAICYILDDFAQIDVESMCAFIRRSVNYDGGIGQGPGLESHGGSTYCAVAALALVGRLWDGTVLGGAQLERLKGWLLLKQGQGFHGRTNKPDDSCYAFWIGATLTMLNAQSLINWPALRSFLLRMQDPTIGGFCKFDGSSHSDILHTYFSLASFGLFGEPHIQPVFPALNISSRVHERLQRLKRSRDADLK